MSENRFLTFTFLTVYDFVQSSPDVFIQYFSESFFYAW